MKKCPYCAELIQDEAIVCRYCGSDLVKTDKPSKSTSKILLSFIIGLAIASLILLFEIATNPYTNLGNLIFHFITNAVIWTVVIGAIVWAWRYQVGRIILVGIVGIAIVVYLIMNSGDVAIPAIIIPTQNKTNTPLQRITSTSRIFNPMKAQEPDSVVISTIIPQDFTEYWLKKGVETIYPGEVHPLPFISSKEIDESYVGEYLSVFGLVVDASSTEDYSQVISLSRPEIRFQLRARRTQFEGVHPWMCIIVTGEIQQDGTSLFMEIDGAKMSEFHECLTSR